MRGLAKHLAYGLVGQFLNVPAVCEFMLECLIEYGGATINNKKTRVVPDPGYLAA